MRKKDIDEARRQFIGNCKGLIEYFRQRQETFTKEVKEEKRISIEYQRDSMYFQFTRLILEFMYENENIYKILEKEITKDFGKRFDREAENDEFFVFERMTKLLKGEPIKRAK